jgi:hypothetical protein
VPATA